MTLLDLAPGVGLRINGLDWTVKEVRPQVGAVVLARDGGESEVRPIRWLMHHRDCVPVKAAGARDRGACQATTREDLTDVQLRQARLRAAHVMEAETGYRSGHPSRALPGEPRPAYDPGTKTVTERRRAKAAELAALDSDEAAMLGLAHMSERTLRRLAVQCAQDLVTGCADDRWTRTSGGHPSVTEEIREAIFAVRRRSRISMRARHRLMHQYVRERFPAFPVEDIPSYFTLRKVWLKWFGPDGARQRYVRSAEAAKEASAAWWCTARARWSRWIGVVELPALQSAVEGARACPIGGE